MRGVRIFFKLYFFLTRKGMSQNTIISYMNDIKSFLKEMNLESNDYVTAADIRKWVNEMLTPTEGKALAVSKSIVA